MRARVGQLEIEYEGAGDPSAPPLLLVMGLGAQLTTWPDGLFQLIAGSGFRTIRFDNRDAGLSTWLDELPAPAVMEVAAGLAQPAYTLDDLAGDAIGLLDQLQIERAHVVGASMGGMIAQLMAIRHPQRVLTLTSIMSTPGGPEALPPTPPAMEVLLTVPPADEGAFIEYEMEASRVLAGGNPINEAEARARLLRARQRAYHPVGTARQLGAIVAAADRSPELARLTCPTLVIHGVDDPLIPAGEGRRTAAAVPGCRLIEIAGMGHNLPEAAWPVIAGAIRELASSATAAL